MDWLEPFARNALITFLEQAVGLWKKSTDLCIRWCPKSGASIEGKVEDLDTIRGALEEIAHRKRGSTQFSGTVNGSPVPYDEFLKGIRIEFRPRLLQASVTPKRWLLLAGNERALRCAASYFRFSNSAIPGMHHHLERHEGMDWLAPEAEALVIQIPRC